MNLNKKYQIKPFVKWAGGKRQILDKIYNYIQDSIEKDNSIPNNEFCYIEPFLGGGAIFFELQPKNAIINDLNEDLINAYKIIKSNDIDKLIDILQDYEKNYKNEEERDNLYYETRQLDRKEEWPNNLTDVQRAARMIFLNKTCYNGLYRVNSKGQFNTPIGRYKNPLICDRNNLLNIHKYLNDNPNIKILCGSYEKAIDLAKAGDIIYIDPPYDYEDHDGFTKYQMQGFTFDDFISLKKHCDKAMDRGAYIIISNNATEKVIDLFSQDVNYSVFYDPDCIDTLRTISCNGSNRKTGKEVIIWGIPNKIPLPQANNIDNIIKILQCEQSHLKDKEFLMEYLGVDTPRQVSYYLSAVSFLEYINSKHEFTNKALEIKKLSLNDLQKSVATDIVSNKIFSPLYKLYCAKNGNIDKEEIINHIKNKCNLSLSTINRRSSTVEKWLEWSYKILNSNRLIIL